MTSKELQALMTGMADPIVAVIKKSLDHRVGPLEQRIKQLESRPLLKYAGIWQSGETYVEGRLVTHAGSLWLATETTTGQPGIAASGFRLIVKQSRA